MNRCSLHAKLSIAPGDVSDYDRLAACHYRSSRPAAIAAIYTLKPNCPLGTLGTKPLGVIVYAMPSPRMELRDVATGGVFAGLDRWSKLAMLNHNVRCIARVIVEPRLRGIGLAVRLVRETLPKMNVPIVECLGVMAAVNPFLERAGMTRFAPHTPARHVELIEALSAVGIEPDELIDPANVHARLDSLSPKAAEFIEARMQRFLKSRGGRRSMPHGLERTRYVSETLMHRPTYYVWLNPHRKVTSP